MALRSGKAGGARPWPELPARWREQRRPVWLGRRGRPREGRRFCLACAGPPEREREREALCPSRWAAAEGAGRPLGTSLVQFPPEGRGAEELQP